MVEVLLRLPGDLKWVAENEDDLKFIESVLVRKLCEMKLGDLLAAKSSLRAEEISELDHLVKAGLFKRMKAVE